MAETQLESSTCISINAGADLTAAQFRFVKLSSGLLALCGAGEQPVGVLMNNPNTGEPGTVQIGGVSKVKAAGSVALDVKLMSNAIGKATAKTGTNNEAGQAMSEATTEDTLVEVLLVAADGVAGGGVGSFENTAITPGVRLALVTVDGTDALTLANGTFPGQKISIRVIAAANTPLGTLTIADAYGSEPTTWLFTDVGQGIDLTWTATGWKLDGPPIQAGVAALVTTNTANPLKMVNVITLDGTNDYILGDGVVPGQRARFVAASGSTASTVSGLFYTLAGAATGVDLGFNAANDIASLVWTGARWFMESYTSVTVA